MGRLTADLYFGAMVIIPLLVILTVVAASCDHPSFLSVEGFRLCQQWGAVGPWVSAIAFHEKAARRLALVEFGVGDAALSRNPLIVVENGKREYKLVCKAKGWDSDQSLPLPNRV